MATVTILRGSWRGKAIRNKTFTILKGFKVGATSGKGFITVDGTDLCGLPTARIRVSGSKDFTINGTFDDPIAIAAAEKNMVPHEPEPISNETDEEILARVNQRFEILNKLTVGARSGDIRALFVCGAPGVGKTFGVEKTLRECGLVDKIGSDRHEGSRAYKICSGSISPIGLYVQLHEFKEENKVLVLDDSDEVFNNEEALNLLKAALDTSKKRVIHWNTDSKTLRKEGLPNSFEFKGSVIFISNKNFHLVRSQKLRDHLVALMSRAHFLDLTVHTEREKMLRIKDLVTNKNMLAEFNLNHEASTSVMNFLCQNKARFNELSLRTVIKLAGLARTFADNEEWKTIAEMSMMGNVMNAIR